MSLKKLSSAKDGQYKGHLGHLGFFPLTKVRMSLDPGGNKCLLWHEKIVNHKTTGVRS